MGITLSNEKIQRLQALADDRGVIAGVSAAHRGSLQTALSEARGVDADEIADETMHELKVAVSKTLTPHASAILLDPEWGLQAAEARAGGVGLLLCYGQSGYDKDRPGRMGDLIPAMSVRRLKELGADAVRILVHYTPFEDAEINDRKQALVERVGSECRAEELPLLLELTGYDELGGDSSSFELAKRKPDIVTGSVREFSKERYGVDLLGVEVPANLAFARGSSVYSGREAYSKEQAIECFRAAAEAAERPFVYSSAGVATDQLRESLHWAAEAGVNFAGVLCGRAAWGDGIAIFAADGLAAFEEWLEDRGLRNVDGINAALANAGSWYSFYGASSAETLAQ